MHQDAVNLFQDDLKKELRECIEWSSTSTTSHSELVEGKYLDEADLREKYKNKPEQLEALLSCARTKVHPTRRCVMYEDAEMKSSSANVEETQEKKRRMMETETFIKKVKNSKPVRLDPENPADDPEVTISKGLFKKMEAFQTKYGTMITVLLAQQATVKSAEYANLVPQFQVEKHSAAIEALEKCQATVAAAQTAKTSKKSEAMQLNDDMITTLKDSKDMKDKIAGLGPPRRPQQT